MTEREHAGLAAEHVFETLAAHDPALVVVPLRASPDVVGDVHDWLAGFDLPLRLVWCNAPDVEVLLAEAGLDGDGGKGRDVWLALGVAAEAADYVVVHDADASSYDPSHVPRLVAPLTGEFSFVKGYYARVENGRLYGRLYRLFVGPLVRALGDAHDADVLDYLAAFRYPLSGEFAATADLARSLSVPRHWGLEVATLGDAFEHAGFAGSAQVDLGRHEHDHRSVGGPSGLADMSRQVGASLFRVVERHGVAPDYATLPDRYREIARRLVDQYAADARFNGLSYDRGAELDQVDAYAVAVEPPTGETELPAWSSVPLDPDDVVAASRTALAGD
jgi:glucosyl-3-phosphoglycerate synthase